MRPQSWIREGGVCGHGLELALGEGGEKGEGRVAKGGGGALCSRASSTAKKFLRAPAIFAPLGPVLRGGGLFEGHFVMSSSARAASWGR